VLAPKTPDPSAEILAAGLTAVAGVLLIPLVLELPKLQAKRLEEWRLEQAPPASEFVEYPRHPEAQA
jgi:hypothetical protein